MTTLSISDKEDTLIIGVTGHRNLLEKDWKVTLTADGKPSPTGYLIAFVETKLTAIKRGHPGKSLVMLTGMAEGADLLVAYVAHKLKIPLIAVLAAERETFLAGFKLEPERVLCRYLLDSKTPTVIGTPRAGITPYQEVGITIARYADEVIALWNGVDTGLAGGTWEVVRLGLTGRDATGHRLDMFRTGKAHLFQLHHLLTPRQDSPHPIPRFFDVTSLQSVLPLGTPYSWSVLSRERKLPSTNLLKRVWLYLGRYRELIWENAIPTLLFLLTVSCGTWGLMDYQHYLETHPTVAPDPGYHHFVGWEAFYKALKLEAIFPPTFDAQASEFSRIYTFGKFMGMIFFLYAFVLVTRKVLGDTLLRWRIRLILGQWTVPFINRIVGLFPYSLILGLNERSYATLADLRDQRKRVVALEPDHKSTYYESSQHQGSTVIGDNPLSPGSLKIIGFHRADEVYLLNADDNSNIHLIQQMDRLLAERGEATIRRDWYVQVLDTAKRQFLTRFTHQQPMLHIYAFNLYETIARRLLLQYPIDRFYRNPTAPSTDVFVFGFGEMGRQIVLNCLKMGHFDQKRGLTLHIFTPDHNKEEASFRNQYPFLAETNAEEPFNNPGIGARLVQEVFGHTTIRFHSLPSTDFELLNENFILYDSIKSGHITSVYFCLNDDLHSASYLSSLLKRLHVLYTQQLAERQVDPGKIPVDIQAFCYYNFPDETESALVEHRFNELAPHIPVICFGDVQRECSTRALRGRALDQIAQLTALYYDEVIRHNASWQLADASAIIRRASDTWVSREETTKESNRLFADHAFAKMRQAWSQLADSSKPAIENASLTIARELLNQMAVNKTVELQLGELEHRRWRAEKLFDGWVPLETDPGRIKESAYKWNTDDNYKTLATSQKRHLDLVPTAFLHDTEFRKDMRMIEGIPLFIEFLRQEVIKKSDR